MTNADAERLAQLERDWANVLATPAGKRVVWDILSVCGLFRPSYTGNADTNFREGQRNVGLWMLDERINPNGGHLFGQMMTENAEWEERLSALDDEPTQD